MPYVVKRPSETRRRGGPTKPTPNRPRNKPQGVGAVIGKYFGFKPKLTEAEQKKADAAAEVDAKKTDAPAGVAGKKAAKK